MLASFLSVTTNVGLPVIGVVVGIEALGIPLPGETAVIFAGLPPPRVGCRSSR